ncbi:hypothetical protein LSG25_11710 [Paralcaligenes sp. KSB-10]|uniref:hypothetical protein n=1 Tax=Paralcaligenes sp. KSB-10 TaxID=2901142 RepID=UPI001E5B961B|nr:hypothetical protein [Paralcaligenes sp. KSB-10]UHL62750.1 hypothetical protein LSG25_11710 [Paralcaligenes sp. KSB-10]
MKDDLPDVHFGPIGKARVPWWTVETPDPDDTELEVTDPAVVAILGFDPKEFSEETADDVSHEAVATKSKPIE